MLRTTAALIGIAMVSVGCLPAASQQPSNPNPSPAAIQRALLNHYCVTCHNEQLKTAGLMLDNIDVERVSDGAEVWEKVIRKLRTGAMPPTGMPRPDQDAYDSFASYLESALDSAAAAQPNAGRPSVHRLNRSEFANSIRDLLELEIDAESLLPADDSGYGFDNIGDVLSVSPMLLEKYISVARQISRLAVGNTAIRPTMSIYDADRLSLQNDRASEALPFGSRGGVAVHHYFPVDGEYNLKVRLQQNRDGMIIGLAGLHHLDVRLDGARIKLFTIDGDSAKAGSQEPPKATEVEAGLEFRFAAKAGDHLVGVAFLDEKSLAEGMFKPAVSQLLLYDWNQATGDPGVGSVSISGPYNAKGAGETPSRRKIFVCHPPEGARRDQEDVCAHTILSALARRAYRRPVTEEEIQTLLPFFQAGRTERNFDGGIEMALRRMLVSPSFLFRAERDPGNAAEGASYRINDLELASRLSYFLWSSMPDDQLLQVAEAGKLRDDEGLRQQVRRMLADPRSKALVDNFVGQWLNLRSLRTATPDPDEFYVFDNSLRAAFEKETELFFGAMLREDQSVVDVLNANFTFVNERLARHYGIPNIYGSSFQRVTLQDEARMGLLGKGSVLIVTSLPNRTSPVARGKWVLENILGTPPPPPPPNVPALQEDKNSQKLTMRQRMEKHRANAVCASCHARMDPLGFALDNFDAIGRWRTTETEASIPIDVSGTLPDGTQFQGPVELRNLLMSRPEQFATTITEKMLTYALGRGVEYYDQPAIRAILRDAAPSNYRWSALILGIVKSAPFQMRTSPERTTTASTR